MPVEETTDIDIEGDTTNLDKLDKAAQKAIKILEKEQKELGKSLSAAKKAERERERLEKRGGIFAEQERELPRGSGAPKDISKKTKSLDEIVEEKTNKIVDKKISTFNESLREEFGGLSGIKNIVSIGKNPITFLTNGLKAIPFIGGVIAFAEFSRLIIEQVAKLDAFFKAFVDRVDTRVNQLRDKQQEAGIQAGDVQLTVTTEAGGTDPRESYNTFNEFNTNQTILESEFAVRDTSGV